MASDIPPPAAGEFGLLDVLVVLAENLKWLILLPLLAGGIGYGVGLLLPKSYTSTSLIKLDDPAAELTLRSAVVTDEVLKQFPGHGDTLDAQRLWLNEKVKVTKAKVTGAKAADVSVGYYTLIVTDADPAITRKINSAVIAAVIPLSRPTGAARLLIDKQFKVVQNELNSVKTSISKMEGELEAGRPVDPLASLYQLRLGYEQQILSLTDKLDGLAEDQIIVSPPTLPEAADITIKSFLGPVAGVTVLMVSVGIMLLRLTLRQSGSSPELSTKLARLKKSLGLGALSRV